MKILFGLLVFLSILLFSLSAQAKNPHVESWYQQRWCDAQGGEVEVRLPDGARVDCLTEEYAVEFDFGKKWAESIGQSLYYSMITWRKPAVVLIVDQGKEKRFMRRLEYVASKIGITVFYVDLNQE